MSTTATQAFAVIKARLQANVPTSNGVSVPLRWQGSTGEPLPNEPAPFIYIEMNPDPGSLVAFGAGRGANLYRNPAVIDAYCFTPLSWNDLQYATDLAEQVAALFRSYRDADISCSDASVFPLGEGAGIKPPGLDSEVDNYFCCTAQVSLLFDQIG